MLILHRPRLLDAPQRCGSVDSAIRDSRFTKDNGTIKVKSECLMDNLAVGSDQSQEDDWLHYQLDRKPNRISQYSLLIVIAEWYSDADMELPNLQ